MKHQQIISSAMTRREFLAASAATFISTSVGGSSSEAKSSLGNRNQEVDLSSNPKTLRLSGSDWFISADTPGDSPAPNPSQIHGIEREWIPAQVPGNIQADLERAHLLRPLWYGAGDPRLAEVPTNDWWYYKDFVLPEAFRNQRLQLVFDGIDFESEVWLNGQLLGTRTGQFRRFEFDVAGAIKPVGQNRLAVRIRRMPEQIRHCLTVSDGAMSGADTPDFFLDCYVYTRKVLQDLKSVTNFAYDWGVNIYTLGIWRDVRLEASGSTRIEWLQIRTELKENYEEATVEGRLELDSQASIKARAIFRVRGQGVDITIAKEASLLQGKSVIQAQIPLHKPALWWPSGQGEQSLYDLEVRLEEVESRNELDSRMARFGVRELLWEPTDGAPKDFINPYRLVVNGRPIRMMGSNIVPPDLLFGRIGERAQRLIRLAKEAGMNTLRMWGGGVTMPEAFYDSADELGIMLSHEFPLADSPVETGPVFLSNLASTATSIVKQLRIHPSIVEWVGGNEMPWQQGTDHPALHVLERVCAENDTRIFRATDPMQGALHGPYVYQPRSHYDHYNRVLESLSAPHPDLGVLTINAMRYGEFGTQSPANLEVFQREIPPSSQWPLSNPLDPILIRKNVLQAAFMPLDWLIKPVIEVLFGPLDTLEALIEAGQFIGAEGLRYGYDELRRKGKRIGGFTSWDFNEPWPNGAGSYMVDYDGRTLMKYDFVKQALSPVSVALRYDSILYDPSVGVNAWLWIASDASSAVSSIGWEWIARDRRGDVITRGSGTSSILPQEARQLAEINVKPPRQTALGPVFVELRLTGMGGQTLAERLHVFGADNVHVWPLDGLLRNTDPDKDDDELMQSKSSVIRVLWIQDSIDGGYEDVAWSLRHFGITSTHILATAEALEKSASDAQELVQRYDAIWLAAGDYAKAGTLAERLGPKSLSILAQAVAAGVGLGVEGGWGGYADAGFEGTPLAACLPVTFVGSGNTQRRGRSAVKVSNPSHPIASGELGNSIPDVSGYNLVKAKEESDIIFQTVDGDSLLVASSYENGRVLAYMSGIAGNVGWVDYPMFKSYQGEQIDWGWSLRAWSGFPFLIARIFRWLSRAPDDVVSAIQFPQGTTREVRPVRRTVLEVRPHAPVTEEQEETLDIELRNNGKMTALFCEPHPLLEYRTDITIFNNHAFIPPGDTRLITIRAPINPAAGLSLGQIGWRVSCWNAVDVIVQPNDEVLLSFGRKDAMCREYLRDTQASLAITPGAGGDVLLLKGNRPNCSLIPWLLSGFRPKGTAQGRSRTLRFIFEVSGAQATHASQLRIHTADQDNLQGAAIEIDVNGRKFEQRLSPGLGIQLSDPAHLAFPATAKWNLPAGTLRSGTNVLEICVVNEGWFSWDSMELLSWEKRQE